MGIDGIKDGFGQPVRFQQAAILQEYLGVRGRFAAQVDPHNAADGLAVVQGVLDAFVRQAKSLLHHVDAQWPAPAAPFPVCHPFFGIFSNLRQPQSPVRRIDQHFLNTWPLSIKSLLDYCIPYFHSRATCRITLS